MNTVAAFLKGSGGPVEHGSLVVAAADPLNLLGILTPGDRVSALSGEKVHVLQGQESSVS